MSLISTKIPAHYRVDVHWGEGLKTLIVPVEKRHILEGKKITLRYRILKNGKFRVLNYLDDPVQVDSVKIDEFGFFVVEESRSEEVEEVPGGAVIISDKMELISQTDRIPAKLGVAFGYRFTVKGTPKGALTELVSENIYPELISPDSRRIIDGDRSPYPAEIGSNNHTFYLFEEDWELVPGKWTLMIKDGERALVKKTFTVYIP